MKKRYIAPDNLLVAMEFQSVVCMSGTIHAEGVGEDIGYGGVDEEGELDPAARRHNVWDEEENLEEEEEL